MSGFMPAWYIMHTTSQVSDRQSHPGDGMNMTSGKSHWHALLINLTHHSTSQSLSDNFRKSLEKHPLRRLVMMGFHHTHARGCVMRDTTGGCGGWSI